MQLSLFLQIISSSLVAAQFGSTLNDGMPITCGTGYVPSLTCDTPNGMCSCTCGSGAVYQKPESSLNTGSDPLDFSSPQRLATKPCTGEVLMPWQHINVRRTAGTVQDSAIGSIPIDNPEDSILLVADGSNRCERFEVYIDGVLVGETSGEGPRDNYKCDAVEKCMKEGADFAYFTLPRGKHTIGTKWVKATDACKAWPNGIANIQTYKPCE
ncbi:hypothetical protein COCSADRAFT_31928 [Bipolaris sorokiniana ND90Pr]|uniref:Uncharacterized protein n=1 Tax=Cochliobolus sativus (strain ND90Pr / ATCC 201652) TaxID=665912 RepID=M2SPM8_COCSN|nr:uncharacterized protein COCSADRAFT_31928 [Bipolaris sorokiniana ND90Pr]EMD69168.1 hypothetical protein COCSADRAFT_31928 [Bipolaris sorokiniana ND90Pr]